MQFLESVGIVREHRCAAEDQCAFVPKVIAHIGLGQDASHQALGFLVALADPQSPCGGEQKAGPPIEFVGWNLRKPFKNRALPAVPHDGFVKAAFGQPVGLLVLACRQCVPGRVLQQPVPGKPFGRGRMHLGLQRRVQGREQLAQHIASERMHAQPFAALGFGENGRLPAEARQSLDRVVIPGHRATQVWMQVIQDRDPNEEIAVAGIKIGKQQLDEMVVQPAVKHGHARDIRVRIDTTRDDRQRELDAKGPAFGHFVQAGGGVVVDARAQAVAHELHGFVESKPKRGRLDHDALSVGHEIVDVQVAVGARSHDHPQIRRSVSHQVDKGFARRSRQAIGLVDEQDDIQRRLRQFREPYRDPLETARAYGVKQGVSESRTPGPAPDCQGEALRQALWFVLLLGKEPRDNGAAGQMLEPPLGQQGSLSEARRGLDDDRRNVPNISGRGQQSCTGNKVTRNPGGRDLEQQVIVDFGGSTRHRRPLFEHAEVLKSAVRCDTCGAEMP